MPEKERDMEKKLLGMLSSLKEQGISPEQILGIVTKALKVPAREEIKIPISVFKNDYLASLENIVKYLRKIFFSASSKLAL